MEHAFNKYQKGTWLLLTLCAFMVIPLSAGVVLLTQVGRESKQVSAQVPAVINKCDFNADNRVDSRDVDIAIDGFGKVEGAKNNVKYDVDKDGWINSKDLGAVSSADPIVCNK